MNIAILGYGIEGESVYRYYHAKFPDAVFTIYDNNEQSKNELPPDVVFVGGVSNFRGITADLAIKTPSIPPWVVDVSGDVTTMTREFLRVCPAPVIGVTGTKGKGTTASLVRSILDAAGKKTWLVGNIGVGAFDVLGQITADDIVVYELSSFQLWDLDISPQVAVVLGIEPEHLDVHRDFDDYVAAKANIASHQSTDSTVIFRDGNQCAAHIASLSKGTQVPYPSDERAHVSDNMFFYGAQQLCSVDVLTLPGQHNRDNACAAIDAVWPWVQDAEVIRKGLAAFHGLPHRLKFVSTLNDISYYDDSIATTPGSAIAALAAFAAPKVIILGGSDKGADYNELAEKIASSNVRQVVVIGSEAPRIQSALKTAGVTAVTNLGAAVTMLDIVTKATMCAQPGDIVILSPACASFGMFKNYADRGDQFIAAVSSL